MSLGNVFIVLFSLLLYEVLKIILVCVGVCAQSCPIGYPLMSVHCHFDNFLACNAGDPRIGKIPWRRERLPTPVFWPGESRGPYSPQGCKESHTTEWLSLHSLDPQAQEAPETFYASPVPKLESVISPRILSTGTDIEGWSTRVLISTQLSLPLASAVERTRKVFQKKKSESEFRSVFAFKWKSARFSFNFFCAIYLFYAKNLDF